MIIYELLELSEKPLKLLQDACISVKDVKYISLYREFKSEVRKGIKVSYMAYHLSKKYGISERKVYYIIKKFSKDCKIPAS